MRFYQRITSTIGVQSQISLPEAFLSIQTFRSDPNPYKKIMSNTVYKHQMLLPQKQNNIRGIGFFTMHPTVVSFFAIFCLAVVGAEENAANSVSSTEVVPPPESSSSEDYSQYDTARVVIYTDFSECSGGKTVDKNIPIDGECYWLTNMYSSTESGLHVRLSLNENVMRFSNYGSLGICSEDQNQTAGYLNNLLNGECQRLNGIRYAGSVTWGGSVDVGSSDGDTSTSAATLTIISVFLTLIACALTLVQ